MPKDGYTGSGLHRLADVPLLAPAPKPPWWMVVFPGVAITGTILAVNLFGDALRDFLDPKLNLLRHQPRDPRGRRRCGLPGAPAARLRAQRLLSAPSPLPRQALREARPQ